MNDSSTTNLQKYCICSTFLLLKESEHEKAVHVNIPRGENIIVAFVSLQYNFFLEHNYEQTPFPQSHGIETHCTETAHPLGADGGGMHSSACVT